MTDAKPLTNEEIEALRREMTEREVWWSANQRHHEWRLVNTIDAQAAEIARLTKERDALERAYFSENDMTADDEQVLMEIRGARWTRERKGEA